MRAILLFKKGDDKSTFAAFENGVMCISPKLIGKEEAQKYIEDKYRSLGANFDEIYDLVNEHNNDEVKRKDPFFWDDPSISLETRDDLIAPPKGK